MPACLPRHEFYEKPVKAQQVLKMQHMGHGALKDASGIAAHLAAKGQTNLPNMLWKFNSVLNSKLQIAVHARTPRYEMAVQPEAMTQIERKKLYIHAPAGRRRRSIDDATEKFVDETRAAS